MPPPTTHPLMSEIKRVWLQAIQAGQRAKERYTSEANACERFYSTDQGELYTADFAKQIGLLPDSAPFSAGVGTDGNAPRVPTFRIRDNAAAKAVQIFTPFCFSGEIVATVKPNKPFLPPPAAWGIVGDANTPSPVPPRTAGQMALLQWAQNEQAKMQFQQAAQAVEQEFVQRQYRAGVQEHVLNYTIKESALKLEAKLAFRDAMVRGLGALLSETIPLPGGQGKLAADTYLDDDCIIMDPDARRLKDAQWVAVYCQHPLWQVAQMYGMYGVQESDLKSVLASPTARATTTHQDQTHPRKNVFGYWKVYSRCGIGARLVPSADRNKDLMGVDQALGDYCYLVVSDGCEYPLNLGPMVEQMAQRTGGIQPFQIATAWPVPFYFDPDDPFPFTSLWFHARKDSPWPVAHLSFGIGYLMFGCWVLGYLADKAYRSARGVWVIDSSVTKKFAAWLQTGQDEEIFEVTQGVDGADIKKFITFIEGAKPDLSLMEIADYFEKKFQAITGLTEVLEASVEKQMRSATEADVLNSASRLRPDDMAATVQHWLARVLRKRAITLRYLFTGQDLLQVLGQYGAASWDQGIRSQDVAELFREATYSVETGRGRPLDIEADLENINQAMQFLFGPLMQYYMQTGDPSQVNGLVMAWAKARQMDATGLLFPPIAPPQQIQMQQQQAHDQQQQAMDQAHDRALAAQQAKQQKGAS